MNDRRIHYILSPFSYSCSHLSLFFQYEGIWPRKDFLLGWNLPFVPRISGSSSGGSSGCKYGPGCCMSPCGRSSGSSGCGVVVGIVSSNGSGGWSSSGGWSNLYSSRADRCSMLADSRSS